MASGVEGIRCTNFDPISALRDTEVTGLTWGSLLEVAPSIRTKVKRALVQERLPHNRSRKEKEVATGEAVIQYREDDDIDIAPPEPRGMITNFYIVAKVTQSMTPSSKIQPTSLFRVTKVMIGGSGLNMMLLDLAEHMHLKLIPQDEVVIMITASTFRAIEYYVNIDVQTAGVVVKLRCYCLPADDTYSIRGAAGNRYVLQSTSVTPTNIYEEIPVRRRRDGLKYQYRGYRDLRGS